MDTGETGIPWWPAGSSGRGTLSRELIARAAADILESGGRSALTMRAVAESVGAGAMSLYWYVDGKDDLVDLAVDEIMSAVEIPKRGAWRARVRRLAVSFRAVIADHPAVVPLLAEGVTVGPHLLRINEALLDALLDAGLSGSDATSASSAVAAMVMNVATGASAQRDRWSKGKDMADLSPVHFPRTVELAAELVDFDADTQFAYGLDLLLDGIELRTGPRRTG